MEKSGHHTVATLDRSGTASATRWATNEASSGWPDLDKMNVSPVIHHLVENMSEEQWKVVHKTLCEPKAMPELGHMCSNIVKAVTQTTSQHLLPALSKMLGMPVRSLIPSGMAKPSKPSHWSQITQYQTTLCELFGITEDSICQNLRDCRHQCERDVVGLVFWHVNSVINLALKQHILKGGRPPEFSIKESTIKTAKDLVRAVSTQVNSTSADRSSSMTQVSSLEKDSVTNSGLISVTRTIINAITDHMNNCLDGEELKQVGEIISAVAERVNMLASQNAFLESPLCSGLPKLTQDQLVDGEDFLRSRNLQKLSTDKFHAKATKAVSDVLMKNLNCLPSRVASSVQCHCVAKCNHLSPSCRSIDQAASAVLETFIKEIKNLAQYTHCTTDAEDGNKPTQDTHNHYAASRSNDRSKAIAAAHMMFYKVQMKLMELYSQPSLKKSCASLAGTEDASVIDQLYQLQVDSATRDVVKEILNTLNDKDLDKESSSNLECSSSQVSMEAREFVDGIMKQLENFTGSTSEESTNSLASSEQDFSVKSSQVSRVSSKYSEICVSNLQVLMCENFLTEASKTVSETLLKSIGSQSSSSFSSQKLQSDASGLPEEPKNVDLAAFDITQNFVSEIKLCAASIEALAPESQMNGDLLKSGGTFSYTANGQLEGATQHFQKTIMTSVKGIYKSMHDKVKQFYSQYESDQNKTASVQQDYSSEQEEHAEELTSSGYERVVNSTKEIIRQLSCLVKTAISSKGNLTNPACVKSYASLKSSTFVDDVISELKNMSASADVTSLDMLTADLHDSVSLIEKLSNTEFQAKASRQVNEVLLKSVISHSSLEDSELCGNATGDSDCIDVRSFLPSVSQSQSIAYDLVGEVIEETVECLISSGFYSLTQSTASDIVENVTGAMKDLLEVKLAAKALQHTKGDDAGAISARLMVNRMCLTANNIFTNIKKRAAKCLHTFVYKDKREASTRKAISQVLASIQDGLPDTEGAENSEQIKLIHDLLSTMIDEIESTGTSDISGPPHLERDRTADFISEVNTTTVMENLLSNRRVRSRRFLSETTVREYTHDLSHQIYQILRNSYDPSILFMPAGKSASDSFLSVVPCREEEKHETPFDLIYSCVEESVKRLILSCFFPLTSRENQDRVLRHAFDLVSSGSSCNSPLSQLTQHDMEASKSSPKLFRSTINVLTQVLAKEVIERLSVDVSTTSPVESDNDKKTFSQLSAREHQQPPKVEQMDESRPPISESSSRTSLSVSDMAVVETVYAIEEDKVMYSSEASCFATSPPAVMDSLSPCAPETHGEQVQIKHEEVPLVVKGVGLAISPPSSELPETEEANNNDYTCFISMLVIRLLRRTISSHHAKWAEQEGLHDNVHDMSRELIDKILPELFLASGMVKCQSYPEDMKIFRIYQNLYQNLVQEYGSSQGLKSAVEAQESSFDTSLIKLLTKEIHAAPSTGNGPEVKTENGTKARRFQLSSRFQTPFQTSRFQLSSRLQTPLKFPKIPINMEQLRALHLPSMKKKQNSDVVTTDSNTAPATGTFTSKLQGMREGLKPLGSCPFRMPKVLWPTLKLPRKYNEIAPCLNLERSEDVIEADKNIASS
ncbi:uncharacterized protein LOC121697476 [Alosa sapidissima]|uniref:uncharacterized protein LOC121697476 n=1 Tax=Alosa sapidissima TaxID=34773 RepID=UPI001C08CF62|nr:uncharacterized protein LOC121697476 [Alosa sapidissima]